MDHAAAMLLAVPLIVFKKLWAAAESPVAGDVAAPLNSKASLFNTLPKTKKGKYTTVTEAHKEFS